MTWGVSMPTIRAGPPTSAKAAASRSSRPPPRWAKHLEPVGQPVAGLAVEHERPAGLHGRLERPGPACRRSAARASPAACDGRARRAKPSLDVARRRGPWRSRSASAVAARHRGSLDIWPEHTRSQAVEVPITERETATRRAVAPRSGARANSAHPEVEVLDRHEAELGGGEGRRGEHVADVAEPVLAGRDRRPARRRRPHGQSAAAISPTLRGRPLAMLNAPVARPRAVRAMTLARATSRTWTKSRSWRPSSKTRGGRPAASSLRKIDATPGVRRVARHPRPVDVVVAQRGHPHADLAGEGEAEMLLMDLGRRVDVARVEPRRLADRLRLERPAALGAERIEAPGREVGRGRAGGAEIGPCTGQR